MNILMTNSRYMLRFLVIFNIMIQNSFAETLKAEFLFQNINDIPPVAILYWPENQDLKDSPTMDHHNGHFTERLIVGSKGTNMFLKNSDDVGHTIYVKDKRNNIRWQLDYMPPKSTFEQNIFWDEDIFVELKCRLHKYMSAWAGSISSKYYDIIQFPSDKINFNFETKNFLSKYKKIKIWMPKVTPITLNLNKNNNQTLTLKKRSKNIGQIKLVRTK